MVSLFSRFVTGGVLQVPVVDPRLTDLDPPDNVVAEDQGPAQAAPDDSGQPPTAPAS